MEEIYTKLQNNEKLSEEEIESLVWDGEQVYEEAGEDASALRFAEQLQNEEQIAFLLNRKLNEKLSYYFL